MGVHGLLGQALQPLIQVAVVHGRPVARVEVELGILMVNDLEALASDLLSKLLHAHGYVAHIGALVASVSKDNPP